MKGSGRAFCAGGDVVALYHLLKEGMLIALFCLVKLANSLYAMLMDIWRMTRCNITTIFNVEC